MDLEQMVIQELRNGMGEAIRKHMGEYQSPLKLYVAKALEGFETDVRALVSEAVRSVIVDPEFRAEMIKSVRHKAARELASAFGEGIFKKTIDSLKQDPTVRARCVLAIEAIVEDAVKKS